MKYFRAGERNIIEGTDLEQTVEDKKDFGKQRGGMEDFREKKLCEGKHKVRKSWVWVFAGGGEEGMILSHRHVKKSVVTHFVK